MHPGHSQTSGRRGSQTRRGNTSGPLNLMGATSNDVVVGHGLSAQGDWTDLVRAADRGLMRIRSDQVLGRQLCHLSGAQPSGKRPLFDVIVGQPYESPNPSCKDQVKAVQKSGQEREPGAGCRDRDRGPPDSAQGCLPP